MKKSLSSWVIALLLTQGLGLAFAADDSYVVLFNEASPALEDHTEYLLKALQQGLLDLGQFSSSSEIRDSLGAIDVSIQHALRQIPLQNHTWNVPARNAVFNVVLSIKYSSVLFSMLQKDWLQTRILKFRDDAARLGEIHGWFLEDGSLLQLPAPPSQNILFWLSVSLNRLVFWPVLYNRLPQSLVPRISTLVEKLQKSILSSRFRPDQGVRFIRDIESIVTDARVVKYEPLDGVLDDLAKLTKLYLTWLESQGVEALNK